MKILVVVNYQEGNETATYDALVSSLAGYEVELQRYRPGLNFNDADKDLVILSGGGGEGSEINDTYNRDELWYQDQIDYVRSSKKPILGICMGFEVIARAYGAKVVEMKDYVTGVKTLTSTAKGLNLFKSSSLKQYENHIWRVPSVPPKDFNVLARSSTGVEIIHHKSRPILATQFHPEKGGSLKIDYFINQLQNA